MNTFTSTVLAYVVRYLREMGCCHRGMYTHGRKCTLCMDKDLLTRADMDAGVWGHS